MNNEYYDRITRFLNNEMSLDERTTFEEELITNASLKEDLEFEKNLIENGASLKKKIDDLDGANAEAKNEEAYELIRKARDNWEEKNTNSNLPSNSSSHDIGPDETASSPSLTTRNKISWRNFSIAAAVVGVIALAVTFYMVSSNRTKLITNTNKTKSDSATNLATNDSSRLPGKTDDQNIAKLADSTKRSTASPEESLPSLEVRDHLFSKYYSPDTESVTAPDILQEPISLYESKRYDEALAAFQTIDPAAATRSDSEEQELTFFYTYYYKGLCFLTRNNFPKAIKEFQQAINTSKQPGLRNRALWYLALAYLKTGDIKKANSSLDSIISNQRGDVVFKKANSLKKEITTR